MSPTQTVSAGQAVLQLPGISAILLFGFETLASIEEHLYSLTVQLFQWRFYFPVLLTGTILLSAAAISLLILLCTVAGRSYRDGETRLNLFHRIPFDLWVALAFFFCSAIAVMTDHSETIDLENFDHELYYEELMKRVASSRRKTNVAETVAGDMSNTF